MFKLAATDLELPENAKILEIGRSAGVSTIVLSKMGFDVTGLDMSPGFIGNARNLATEEKEPC